jgi:hypothetical protein
MIARSPGELQLILDVRQGWSEKNRKSINVNKTKLVMFLEVPDVGDMRPRFAFTLSQAFPTVWKNVNQGVKGDEVA